MAKISDNLTQIIDFHSSNISWKGESEGLFSLASVLKVNDSSFSNKNKIICLGKAVLAGNMYVNNGLLKKPPYLFQVMGSLNEQKIFRSFINKKNIKIQHYGSINYTSDTYGEYLLENFNIDCRYIPAEEIKCYTDFENYFILKKNFSAIIQINFNNIKYIIEFPINHSNIKPKDRMFQIETGPVLLPILEKKSYKIDYLPCFLHFNRFDRIDILYDYPFMYRTENLPNNGVINNFNCSIVIYSNISSA